MVRRKFTGFGRSGFGRILRKKKRESFRRFVRRQKKEFQK